ncbi:MAG: FAD-dependent oxidoreductase, partial [Thermodesulfobacteriota bacterium]
MDKKYGAYICTGCGIGDSLDIDGLTQIPKEEGFPCKTHSFLCGKEGVELLNKDISEGINSLVIAACSRRVNFDTFRFSGCLVDRVNLREGVVWSHPRTVFPALSETDKADAQKFDRVQMMAEDYIKMGMARIKKSNLPEPYRLTALSRKILVIGGGITGMSAALDAANAGYAVTIVEKETRLGGHGNDWRKQLPVSFPYDNLTNPAIEEKINAVQNHPNITIKTETVVARIAGQPGEFLITVKKPGEKIEFDVPFPLPPEMRVDESGKELDPEKLHERYLEYNKGKQDILTLDPNGELFGAVILAAGWRAYEPQKDEFSHLGFGVIPDVVTNQQFEKIAKSGKITRPS